MSLLDKVWPMCPSGMDHRVRLDIVTNCLGNEYCWHEDCMKENHIVIEHLNAEEEQRQWEKQVRVMLGEVQKQLTETATKLDGESADMLYNSLFMTKEENN